MPDSPVSRSELESRERLLAAELLAKADERAEKRIVTAVEAAVTSVTLHIGLSEKTTAVKIDGLETATSTKIDGLRSSTRLWISLGLVGGQTVAATVAAYITGNGQKVEAVTAAAVSLLPLL